MEKRPLLKTLLASTLIAGLGLPAAAGDGSEAAFRRIRSELYQAITVAEPLNLWAGSWLTS